MEVKEGGEGRAGRELLSPVAVETQHLTRDSLMNYKTARECVFDGK